MKTPVVKDAQVLREELTVSFHDGYKKVKELNEVKAVSVTEELAKELAVVNRNLKRINIDRLSDAVNNLYKLIADANKKVKKAPAKKTPLKKAPVENSIKKPEKKQPALKEITAQATPTKVTKEPEKPAKKITQAVDKVVKKADKEELPVSKSPCFPASLKVKIDGETKELILQPTKYKNSKEVEKAIDEGKELYFACYWSKKLLKQFDYGQIFSVKEISSFPHDLDIVQPLVFCETLPKLHAVSIYTEAMLAIQDFELKEVVEGERFSGGMNFQIYTVK